MNNGNRHRVNGDNTTHAFHVKHLLPIWFDIQRQEWAHGGAPARRRIFG